MPERLERHAGNGPGTGGLGSGWLGRALALLAMSRRERPWRSDIDFQKMAKDLVEAAREEKVVAASPQNSAERALAMLDGCLGGMVKIIEIQHERLTMLENDRKWLWRAVFGLSFIAAGFLGIVLGTILGV